MNKRVLPCLVALMLATTAHSAQVPDPSQGDPRIRYVNYDPNDVVVLYSRVGLSLLIQFEADEQLVDMVGGDVDAWGAASTKARNGIFLKPAAVAPDTNIHVITTRRTYNFEVKLAPRGKSAYLTVRFRYPAALRAADAATKESDLIRTLLDAAAPTANRHYMVQGSSELAPIEAWDDGRTTFLRFRARSSIPAIYGARGDDDSLEQLESQPMKDDVVQVQGVRRKLVLRIGRQVACVFNEGFNSNAAGPATNTASPYVKRTLKGSGK
jgi:type IV secretion system protein VirB9